MYIAILGRLHGGLGGVVSRRPRREAPDEVGVWIAKHLEGWWRGDDGEGRWPRHAGVAEITPAPRSRDSLRAIMLHRLSTVFVALLAIGASSCTGYTGIKGSKKLSELDTSERKEVCENSQAHFEEEIGEDRVKNFACVTGAVLSVALSGGGVPECEAAVDLCLMEPAMTTTSTCDVDGATSCEATIEEYEACGDENIAALRTFYDGYTCEVALSGSGGQAPTAGPECQALAKKCPELFTTQGE
jgi:hypothetical protein